jgi:hypothetical protein
MIAVVGAVAIARGKQAAKLEGPKHQEESPS